MQVPPKRRKPPKTRGTKACMRRPGQRTGRRCSTEKAEARAKRIACLYAQEAQLAAELAKVRHDRDRELVRASTEGVPGAVIGHATLVATGRPQTDAELRRVETKLRKAAHTARKRVAAGNKSRVAAGLHARETVRMRNQSTPYRRRVEVTEEWYSQPLPEELGSPLAPTLVGDDDLGDPDDDVAEQDDDLDDEDE